MLSEGLFFLAATLAVSPKMIIFKALCSLKEPSPVGVVVVKEL